MFTKRTARLLTCASIFAVLVAFAAAISVPVADAIPATLHLNAVVQKPKSLGAGTYSTRKELFEGAKRVGEDHLALHGSLEQRVPLHGQLHADARNDQIRGHRQER